VVDGINLLLIAVGTFLRFSGLSRAIPIRRDHPYWLGMIYY